MMRAWWWVLAAVGCTSHVGPDAPRVPTGAAIGTADPIELVTRAKDGRWLVACQARKDTDGVDGTRVTYGWNELRYGDDLHAYLFRGAGAGTPIDAIAASSDDDRWLAVLRGGRLVLIDDRSGQEVALRDADLSPHRGVPRAAVFDRSSDHLIFFRSHGAGTQITNRVVVRALATGEETEWPMPAGLVWRVEPELGSTWARVELVERDSDGDGALAGMNLRAENAGEHRCAGDLGDEIPGWEADALRPLWLDLTTGAIDDDPDVIGHLGATRVLQGRDRAVRVDGETVIPAACDAAVHVILPNPLRLVATCAVEDATLEIFGPRFHVAVAGSTGSRPSPEFAMPNESHVLVSDAKAICPGYESCFRIADGAVLLRPPQRATSTGDRILRTDVEGSAIIDVASGRAMPVAVTPDEWMRAWGLHHAAYGRKIVELATARIVGEVMRLPIAIDAAGRSLLPSTGCDRELCIGPLRWVAPRAVVAEPPPSGAHAKRARATAYAGRAVDAAGAPIAGAVVTINELQNQTVGDTTSTDEDASWRFAVENPAADRPALPRSSQWRIAGARSDARGAFRVSRSDDRPTTLMLVAPDGRVGLVSGLTAARSDLVVQLRKPGEIRVTCTGALDRIELWQGELEISAACGDRITGVPPGAYRVVAPAAPVVAVQSLEVPPDRSVELRVTPPAQTVVRGRAVTYPANTPLAGATCHAYVESDQEHAVGAPAISAADGSFALRAQPGELMIACKRDGPYWNGRAHVRPGAPLVVRVVPQRRGGVNVGVEADSEPRGVRVSYAFDRAVRAGLRAGDLITAVDDAPLADLDPHAMRGLALDLPPDAPVRWTVERAGRTITVISEGW